MNQDPIMGEVSTFSRRSFLVAAGVGTLAFLAGCSSESITSKPVLPPSTEILPGIVPDNDDPQLKLLDQYEHAAGVAPHMMKFIGFPESHEDAINIAASMAGFLQEWYREGAQPIIIMEPTFNGGQDMMDLKAFSKGDYDGALNTFFATLKELGVTDKDMGTWTPFPESNTPTWEGGITDPKLFISNTTKAAKTCKQYFPTTPVSVMLDSQTFLPSPDPNWANGTMNPNALLQYLNFESGLIDSFGLQGFTWDDRDNPATYLSAKAAIAGAKQLGVKNVWFNTGTYSVVNNPNGEGIIKSSNKRRAQVLDEVLAQVLNVQNSGLKVDYINIFGQDTFEGSSTGTGTANYQYDTPEATVVLKEFVKSAEEHQIPVTIFDAT